MLEFGEPVGYTYRATNVAATMDFVLDVFVDQGYSPMFSLHDIRESGITPDSLLRTLAEVKGIEYDDERSYDSNDFPKPLFLEQLQCGDREWTELAPDHQWEPISLPKKDQTCRWCGREREV